MGRYRSPNVDYIAPIFAIKDPSVGSPRKFFLHNTSLEISALAGDMAKGRKPAIPSWPLMPSWMQRSRLDVGIGSIGNLIRSFNQIR